MIYKHTIKHDGIIYPAGTDVPVELHIIEVAPIDEVPVGEVEEVKDDNTDAFDADGNPIGTVNVEDSKKTAGRKSVEK